MTTPAHHSADPTPLTTRLCLDCFRGGGRVTPYLAADMRRKRAIAVVEACLEHPPMRGKKIAGDFFARYVVAMLIADGLLPGCAEPSCDEAQETTECRGGA